MAITLADLITLLGLIFGVQGATVGLIGLIVSILMLTMREKK